MRDDVPRYEVLPGNWVDRLSMSRPPLALSLICKSDGEGVRLFLIISVVSFISFVLTLHPLILHRCLVYDCCRRSNPIPRVAHR